MYSADGGGTIDSSSISMIAASCTNTKNAIQRTVTVNSTIYDSSNIVDMELWLEVNELGTGLSNSENVFKPLG